MSGGLAVCSWHNEGSVLRDAGFEVRERTNVRTGPVTTRYYEALKWAVELLRVMQAGGMRETAIAVILSECRTREKWRKALQATFDSNVDASSYAVVLLANSFLNGLEKARK